MKAKELATPLRRVATLYNDITVQEAIAKMDKSRYQMIPVVERNSQRYLYSLSTGDILRHIIALGDLSKAMKDPISAISMQRLVLSANEETEIADLFDIAINQNYVPLVDRSGVFKGILTRRSILTFLNPGDKQDA